MANRFMSKKMHLLIKTGIIITCCFSCMAGENEFPPGVPNPIGPDGRYTHAMMFTTKAYETEARKRLIAEANDVAQQLQLPEKLPITESNMVSSFISPFGYAYAKKALGTITTTNYAYFFSQGSKFSYLVNRHQDELCREFETSNTLPISVIDTNDALTLAKQWLAAVSMDLAGLNRDCVVTVKPDTTYIHSPAGKFVPVYYVLWSKHGTGPGTGVASVRAFTPNKTLLQLRVQNASYILRPPIVFTNLAELLLQTNGPQATNVPTQP